MSYYHKHDYKLATYKKNPKHLKSTWLCMCGAVKVVVHD